MKLIEKIKQMCDSWNVEDKPCVNGLHRIDIEDMLEQMHEWTKEKALESFCFANCPEPMKKVSL